MTNDSMDGLDVTEQFPRVPVGTVPFAVATLEEASAWFVETAASKSSAPSVRLANAYCVALASTDEGYGRLLREEGINFPDGMPVMQAMRLLAPRTGPRPGRVRGPSFFDHVIGAGVEHGIRHFFLGATDETLEALLGELRHRYPGVRISGTYSPPFAPVTDAYLDDLVGHIQSVDADIIWVGLGTPKQDHVAQVVADRTGLPTAGVGAAFDFVAGTVREAPRWVQRSGFEWLFRLVSEPRRLWRRYLFGNARFLWVVGRQLLRRRTG